MTIAEELKELKPQASNRKTALDLMPPTDRAAVLAVIDYYLDGVYPPTHTPAFLYREMKRRIEITFSETSWRNYIDQRRAARK